jgi:nucleoside-diphosphate-sugar epimerase
VAVIGGSGFIGRHLTDKLRATGSIVTVVSRNAGAAPGDRSGIRYFPATVADAAGISEAIAGSEVVYDLSLGGGMTWADYERDFVQGARNVAAACRAHGVRRLIYTSSISAVYLGRAGKLTESGGADPRARERSFYGRAKAEAENLLLALHRQENLPVVIVRPAIVLGSGGMLAHGALGMAASDTCILGWGRGRNPLPCVLARDVAEAMVLAKDAPGVEGKTFNLSGDIRPTAEEFVGLLRQRTKRNFRFYPRSLLAMGAMEWFISTVKSIVGKPPDGMVYRDLQSLTMAADLDCSAAKQELGWKPENDPDVFFREAIDVHLKPFDQGDLRLETAGSGKASLAR